MPVKPIQHESITSFEQLDQELTRRQAGVRTVPNDKISNIQGEQLPENTIQIEQKPTYKSNIEKNVG